MGLAIVCVTAACALNMASSKFSYGDGLPAGFPKRVGIATLTGNLSAHEEATDRFSRGLVDLGFQVVARSWDLDRVLRWSGDGVMENIPEPIRKELEARYGLQGIFVGILSQDKGRLVDETRLTLRLISVSTGRLIWSTNVVGDAVIGLSPTAKEMGVAAAEKALRSLEKDILPARAAEDSSNLFRARFAEKPAAKIRLKYRGQNPAYRSVLSGL